MKWMMILGCLCLGLIGCVPKEIDKISRYSTRYILDGFTFLVKDSKGERVGPRGNIFSDEETVVFQDESGSIHLRLRESEEGVLAAEIVCVEAKGFGLYEFVLEGNLDQIPAEVMVSPFLYYDDENEIDIEFSTWSRVDNEQESPWLGRGNYQFIRQPYYQKGHSVRPDEMLVLDHSKGVPLTSYRVYNLEDKVQIEMYEGGFEDGELIQSWEYSPGVLKGNLMRFRLNLYLRNTTDSKLNESVEVVLKEFKFKEISDRRE